MYKKGDKLIFGNSEITITTKRGADAVNKYKPKSMSDLRKIARKQRMMKHERSERRMGVDRDERFLTNNILGVGFRSPRKGLTNLNSLDDLARF